MKSWRVKVEKRRKRTNTISNKKDLAGVAGAARKRMVDPSRKQRKRRFLRHVTTLRMRKRRTMKKKSWNIYVVSIEVKRMTIGASTRAQKEVRGLGAKNTEWMNATVGVLGEVRKGTK